MFKKLLSVVACFCLFLAPMVTLGTQEKASQPKQETKKELVMNSCGNEFSIVHWTVQDDTVSFDYYLQEDGSIEKYEKPLVFKGYHVMKPDSEGNTPFAAQVKLDDGWLLVVNGLYKGDKAIAVLLVDGDLGHIFWGHLGKVDDIVKEDANAGSDACREYHQINREQIPSELAKYLK